jgi:hypothetical protein
METHESDRNIRGFVSDKCFETSRCTKLADKFYAFLLAVLLPIPMIALPCGLGTMAVVEYGLPCVPVVAVTLVVLWCCLRLYWKWILSKLRFCIIFHSDHLQIGRGLAEYRFPYEDIELISLSQDEGSWIKFQRGDKTAKVNLEPARRLVCLQMLSSCCINALFIDEQGREHLPKNPTRPDLTLTTLEHFYRVRTRLYGLASVFMGCMFAGHVWALIAWHNGQFQLDHFKLALSIGLTICYGIMTMAGAFYTRKSWCMATTIHDKRECINVS